jgi:hypothetical protein
LLFGTVGIDFDQWKALTAALLKLDFRLSAHRSHPGQQVQAAAALFLQVMFYTLFGLMMAFFVAFGRDLFLGGTVAMTCTMFIIGTAVLLDHNSALASPSDYGILGFRPITSRTYLAVRLTNVLVYTTVLTTLAVWLPVAALFVRYGAAVGAAGIVAFYACSTSTTLAILTGYAWMLRVIGPDTIKRALSYVQLVMSFLVYGGYMLMSRILTRRFVASVALAKTPWLLLFPVTWFASYLELAAGRIGPMEVIPAAASVLAFVAMASKLGGRLSLDYSERLGAMMTAAVRPKEGRTSRSQDWSERGLRSLFQTGEARAVALLVRSQFRNDQKFRMGVLSILPMTLMYVFLGVRDGAVGDPFVSHQRGQGFSPVAMAVMMFPSILKMHLTRSDAFRASWVFFACPSDRMQIVRSSKNVLVTFFLLPYLLFLTVLYTYFAGNVVHVAVHIALLGLLSHLVLQVAVFLDPELPFSKPMQKGRNQTTLFGFMTVIMIVSIFLEIFSAALYASLTATLAAFTVILLASLGVDRLTRVRVARETGSLEFEG